MSNNLKVEYAQGMDWSLAFASFLCETFSLSATVPNSGVSCSWEARKHLALRVKTLKGRLPLKREATESKGRERTTIDVDWSAATGKKSTLSPFERSFALVLRDYGDFVDMGIERVVFAPKGLIEVKSKEDGEPSKFLMPHDGVVQDLWSWSSERAYEEVAAKEKEAKEKEAQPA